MHDLSKPVYFDIDGLCQLKVYGDAALVHAVASELKFYEIDPGEKPLTLDLELGLERLSSFNQSSNPRGMPPFDFPGRHKLARWMIRFERLSQPPRRIRFYGNFASRLIVAKQVVEPAIRWLAQPLGFIFTHSTCICNDSRGALVAGQGGSGKTRLLLRWLAKGNPFLSDDYTILSYGQARRFVTPLRIGARLLAESGAGNNLSASRKVEVYARTVLRRLLFGYAKLQAKVDIRELFPQVKIPETLPLKAVVIISGRDKKLVKIDPEEAAEFLARINREEMYGFADCLVALSELTNDPELRDFFVYQKERLSEFLKPIACHKIGALRDFRRDELDGLLEEISRLSFK